MVELIYVNLWINLRLRLIVHYQLSWYIPKSGKDEKRGLGIPATEDKLVQLCAKQLLEAIFEPDFLDCSYGFIPAKSCHTAIDMLRKALMTKPINYVVAADIRKFFDNLYHYIRISKMSTKFIKVNFRW